MEKMIYVCSPYKTTDFSTREENIEKAKTYASFVAGHGHAPFVAHLAICSFLDDDKPLERRLGMEIDKVILDRCDELWIFGEYISEGMAHEIAHAARKGLPIRRFTEQCVEVPWRG